MRILVVSDNHRDEEVLRYVLNSVKDIDVYLHAGDSELSELELRPFIGVKGNRDHLITTPFRIISTPIGNIYLTHGHLERNNRKKIKEAKANNCNIIVHGHVHKSNYQKIDDMTIICPGALNYPRGGENRRYAIMDINQLNNEIKVQFFDLL